MYFQCTIVMCTYTSAHNYTIYCCVHYNIFVVVLCYIYYNINISTEQALLDDRQYPSFNLSEVCGTTNNHLSQGHDRR